MNQPSRGRELLKSAILRVGGRDLQAQAQRARAAWELAKPRRFLLLNSHMRSYSSLLSHVLASTGEVCGYTEMRRSYRAEADLLALAWQVRSTNGARLTGPVILDKLLHKSYVVTDDVLQLANVSILIAVREPVASLKSIVAMGRGIDPDHHWADPTHACHHYVERLASLADLAERAIQPVILDPDKLTTHTDVVLLSLQQAFDLKQPLERTYPTRELTGAAEYGDTSAHISTGTIVHDRSRHDDVDLDGALIAQANEAAESFWDRALRLDTTIIRPN